MAGGGRSLGKLLALACGPLAVALIGGAVSRQGRGRWYRKLAKPPFQPPPQLFGPVWTALYTLMTLSAWRVWKSAPSPERTRALRLWGTQLALNGAWSPIFFGLRRPTGALVTLGALLLAIGAYTRTAGQVDRPAAWMMAPYLGWSGFALALNEEIVRRN